MTEYPSPNKGSTPLDYAKFHAAQLNATLNRPLTMQEAAAREDAIIHGDTFNDPEPSQEEIRQCVVNAWYVTEWLDRVLDFKTPSLYRSLVADRDRWKAIAEAPRPRRGFWRRVRDVFFP